MGATTTLAPCTRTLAECESVIDGAIQTFREVAIALWEIKSRKLWAQTGHESFVSYCAARHSWAKTYGYDVANCGEIMASLPQDSAIAEKLNEGQVRKLARVPKEKRAKVLKEAAATAACEDRPMTARDIAEAAEPEDRPHVESADEILARQKEEVADTFTKAMQMLRPEPIEPLVRAKILKGFRAWVALNWRGQESTANRVVFEELNVLNSDGKL